MQKIDHMGDFQILCSLRLWLKVIFFCLAALLFACHSPGPLFDPPTPTVTPVVIQLQVAGTVLPPQPLTPTRLTHELTLTPGYLLPTATATVTPSPTVTPLPTPEPEAAQPDSPVSVDVPAIPAPVSAQPEPPMPSAGNIFSGNLTGRIRLMDPSPGYALLLGQDQLEFKWHYAADDPKHPCRLEPGYGFEIRLWPHPTSPYVSPTERANIQPQGVADAKEVQSAVVASCDPQTGIRRLLVPNLGSAPGVAIAGGRGQFFWDVAFVQLEPYYLLLNVSAPNEFFIPTSGTPVPPQPTPTATLVFPLTPFPKPTGSIALLKPDFGSTFPVPSGPVQFEWRWDGAGSEACQLAAGYGFELRLWSTQPDFTPLGVIDAVADRDLIRCDPATGVYSLIVPDLIQASGVAATYQGELRWTGRFWWDVALVSLQPYLPPEVASPARELELSVYRYAGPPDWFGRSIRCSQFTTWPEAQAFFLAAGGPDQDPNNLDPDGNGYACEELI